MSPLYRELAERFRGEVEDLDRTVQRALHAWERAESAVVDQDAYLDSVALNLHSFYSGLERLFELVVRYVDGTLLAGATWHRDLLHTVSHETTDVRPAVIDADMASNLMNSGASAILSAMFTQLTSSQREWLGCCEPCQSCGLGCGLRCWLLLIS